MQQVNYGIPNRLKELRLEKKLTVRDLADKVNINFSTLSQFETERHEMPIERIITLCEYFKCSLDYMLKRSNERLMAHQLPKCKQDELTRTENDILLAIRRIDNESTLQNIKGVVEVISNNSNGGIKEEHNTVIDTPRYDARKELKHTIE
jgi:transcriptional regulator with XRE-family HTH domain